MRTSLLAIPGRVQAVRTDHVYARMRAVRWLVSNRFLKEADRSPPRLQQLVRQEIAHLQRHAASDPSWVRHFDTVEGLRRDRVLKADLGRGHRLLFHRASSEV